MFFNNIKHNLIMILCILLMTNGCNDKNSKLIIENNEIEETKKTNKQNKPFFYNNNLKKMGNKKLTVELQQEINEIPESLKKYNLLIGNNKMSLDYTYDLKEKQTGITNLLQDIKDSGLKLRDLKTEQSNLEKIFVTLVRENNEN